MFRETAGGLYEVRTMHQYIAHIPTQRCSSYDTAIEQSLKVVQQRIQTAHCMYNLCVLFGRAALNYYDKACRLNIP